MDAPPHLPALDHDPRVRADALALLERVRRLRRDASTDLAVGVASTPAAAYADPALWAREVAALRTLPLPVALSCELPLPGCTTATEVLGTPLLLLRGEDGQVRARVNACRHRGVPLVPAGRGRQRRLVCPQHAWCYDLTGALERVEAAETFGEVDRAATGLRALPAAERAGLVFVSLTPGGPLDVDAWLGPELLHLLEALDLAGCHHHTTRELSGPNWKLVLDGYLESYHVQTAHADSVHTTVLSNTTTFDSWGPHVRSGFALRAGTDGPADVAEVLRSVSAVYWLFPGLNVSGAWTDRVAVSLVLPGASVGTSTTVQHLLLRRPPEDDAARAAADAAADALRDVVDREDYALAWAAQRGLGALGDEHVLLGRNEPAVQHFHRSVAEHLHGQVAAGR